MNRLRDCIYGQAVGDALGVPYEFCARGTFKCDGMTGFGTHRQPAGTWSDDTSMTLAICDSYRVKGYIDIDDIRNRFLSWFYNDEYTCDYVFDVGNTTASALKSKQGNSDEYSNGNGSLMRTLPLAFTNATNEEIEAVSAITHAHQISTKACVTLTRIARMLIDGSSPRIVAETLDFDYTDDVGFIRSGGYVLDTLYAAFWCLVTTSTYEKCVLKAVNLGDDTDTTATIAGGLAGIAYGIDQIPSKWIEQLRNKETIERCLF